MSDPPQSEGNSRRHANERTPLRGILAVDQKNILRRRSGAASKLRKEYLAQGGLPSNTRYGWTRKGT
jgi:hypothetical protein